MVNESDKTPSNELFFPPVTLSKSATSETKQLLYSATTSSQFGPGSKLEIYIRPDALPTPRPKTIDVMVYSSSPGAKPRGRVYRLIKKSVHAANAVRYDNPEDGYVDVRSVYLPEGMVGRCPPEEVFLELRMEKTGKSISPDTSSTDDLVQAVVSRGADYWLELSHTASNNGWFEAWQRKLLYRVGKHVKSGRSITDKQARWAIRLMHQTERER